MAEREITRKELTVEVFTVQKSPSAQLGLSDSTSCMLIICQSSATNTLNEATISDLYLGVAGLGSRHLII